jgi:hypothetical protein
VNAKLECFFRVRGKPGWSQWPMVIVEFIEKILQSSLEMLKKTLQNVHMLNVPSSAAEMQIISEILMLS